MTAVREELGAIKRLRKLNLSGLVRVCVCVCVFSEVSRICV